MQYTYESGIAVQACAYVYMYVHRNAAPGRGPWQLPPTVEVQPYLYVMCLILDP